MEERILLLALRGRDAEVCDALLGRQGHACHACRSLDELAEALGGGAGTAVVTEESLADGDWTTLSEWLAEQPPWSDFPFVLLATKRSGRRPPEARRMLERLGNVVVLERPINGETLLSAAASALRVRRRQYEARSRLRALAEAEARLTQLNATLESRIGERTAALSAANNKLMQEVSERERAQAALAQSQKMEAVGQLTGGIAHDFNNLLTVIVGNLDLIRRAAPDPRTERLAGYAREAADRAAKLTHQLLAFSRTQRLTLEPVDLNDLVAGMSDLLRRTIGARVAVTMEPDPQPPWAMADANQLELAVLNLAINARDAMNGEGQLHIATALRAAMDGTMFGVVAVSDTGGGIPAHLLDKVFDPFFTTKPIGQGTGLGLAQVHGIAEQSGGFARVESVEGRGATVEIWLPEAPAAAVRAQIEALPVAPEDGRRRRVLVIDDDAGVRRFIVDCLQYAGYAVTEAADGAAGLARLGSDTPELMIVDYAMPGLNGVEVATRARETSPHLPILLATGYADMEAVQKVIAPQCVLRKPFEVAELEQAVRRALAPGATTCA